jgi:hypothetical protein
MARWLCVLFLCCCGFVSAQTFRGSIQGRVNDPTGAAIPNAAVKVISNSTGLTREISSNAQGEYIASELPPGDYNITVVAAGFRTQMMKNVTVIVGSVQRADAQLQTGQVQEVLEVNADVPLVETSSNVMGGSIEGEQIKEMPVNGRDFTKLLVLVPGATGDPVGSVDSPGSFGLFSVNGNRGRSNNYLLDGTDMNDGYRNLPAINEAGVYGTPATVLPTDALAEVPVMSNVDAEFGRNSGGIVNLVTRSGGNSFHGSAFEDFRNTVLNARNYFNTKDQAQDPFHNNQYGASAGGAIVKDRTFWFLAYEGQREGGGLPVEGTVPTQADITANTPATGVNPVIAKLLARNPWGVLPVSGDGTTTFNNPFYNLADNVIAKVDQHLGKDNRDLLTVRYFYGNSDQSFPLALLASAGPSAPGYNTYTPTRVNILSASYTKILTPKLLMEFRGGYNRFHEDFFAQDNSFNPNSIGLETLAPDATKSDWGLPIINITRDPSRHPSNTATAYSSLGANSGDPRGRIDSNYQLFWNASYTKGTHNLKWGYEWRRTFINGFFDSNFRGKLSFNSLGDFLAGTVDGGSSANGTRKRYTYENNSGAFVQDNWQATKRLTINYGMRWDYFGVIGEKNHQLSVIDPTSGSLIQIGSEGHHDLYPKNFKNFGPRLSAAYDVYGTGKTVLRTGWGLSYDAYSQDFFTGQLPWNTSNPGVAYNDRAFTSTLSNSQLNSGTQVFVTGSYSPSDAWTVAKTLPTPRVQNFNLNIEQQIASGIAFQLGYVGSQGRHLFRYRDLNQLDANGNARYSQYVAVNQFESEAASNYNSLQASLKLSKWHGLTSTLNYTWGHSIDDASDGQDFVPGAAQPDNSFNPSANRASSNFDTRQRIQWFWNYAVPTLGGPKWLSRGWGLNGVVLYSTGQPFTVDYEGEGNFNGGGEYVGHLDLVGDPHAGTHGPTQFLNLAAFAAPCTWEDANQQCVAGTQHYGTNGRNAFRGSNYTNVDFSVAKTNKLNDKLEMQIRADIFNILNHANFANPILPAFSVDALANSVFGPSTSGVATGRLVGSGFLQELATPDVGTGNPYLGGGGPRNIQLGVRFNF